MCVCVLVTQSCPTLCDPMDYSHPGSSVHGILQARILEWVVISFLRESDLPNQGLNLDLSNCRQILYCLSQQGSLMVLLYFRFSTLGKSLNICMSSSFIFKMEIITYLPDQAVVMLKGDDTTSQCLEE